MWKKFKNKIIRLLGGYTEPKKEIVFRETQYGVLHCYAAVNEKPYECRNGFDVSQVLTEKVLKEAEKHIVFGTEFDQYTGGRIFTARLDIAVTKNERNKNK